ncbi:YtxH domain-containing protein [Dehalogenimonas sp. 4OHTPN]|uniref:YtxH domain-containing protein n=1 Tax=Dehalogenimonas sp. 4OHTPN TaxID=3166643 RepID=A0AAU8G7I1_9CHLR
MSSDSTGNFSIGLILGVAIGIGIGFMYAPQPGSATRALLKEKAIELSDKAEELADKVKEGASAARNNLENRLPPVAQ